MMNTFYFFIFFISSNSAFQLNVSNKENLYSAFTEVFQVSDQIQMNNDVVLRMALLELEKLGLNANLSNICNLNDLTKYRILMKASLGEYLFSLKDPNDWSIVVMDVENGQISRKRSFSSTRFAVLETLLIVSVLALGRLLWLK